MRFSSTSRWALAVALVLAGCASGNGGGSDSGVGARDDGGRADAGARDGGGRDGGGRDGGGTSDAGPPDAGPQDGGDLCFGVTCDAFQYCDAGACVDYPPCGGDGSCPNPSDVCHNRRCVPGDVDVDGDGSPAAEDCDETNPLRSPLLPEICNLADDDCDDSVDEGDTTELCALNPGGGICIEGSCGCPSGTYDLDRAVPGCECVAAPPLDQGTSCRGAIDLGDLADSGQSQRVQGNVLPDTREVWYRFRGVDSGDSACDNYHVRALLLENPANTFEFTVFRGSCDAVECADGGFADYRWATDFRAMVGDRLAGQCPCFAPGTAAPDNVSECGDDTAEYFVRVRRRAGSTLGCQNYALEVSNGLYDTM